MLTLLIAARTFQFGSALMLVGVMVFRWVVLLPAFAATPDDLWRAFRPLCRQLNQLFVGSALVLILSGVAQFWGVAAEMGDCSLADALHGEILRAVLWQTQFGRICQWRLGLAVILVILMVPLVRNKWHLQKTWQPLEIAVGMLAIALSVSMAGMGHAAASAGTFALRIMADGLHLFAASIWPAGLLPFALFLRNCQRIDNPPAPVVAVVLRRFSDLSLFIVVVLIMTGIANTFFLVGSFRALMMTDYGRILCLKLALFLAILGIAAWNRFRLLPLLFTRPQAARFQQLFHFVAMEFVLAMAIVVVVSFLGVTAPAH